MPQYNFFIALCLPYSKIVVILFGRRLETIDIIKAIKNNNSQALVKVLYKTAFPPIERHIKQKRGTRADAEDCFQEAVLSLIKKVKSDRYDQQYEAKNFLFILARNNWYNKLKRSGKVIATDLEDYNMIDNSIGAEELMIDNEKQKAMAQLMDKAGDRCRELMKLILFENKKMKEVAKLMGYSTEDVVKTNHYRCKKKLKEALLNNRQLLTILKSE